MKLVLDELFTPRIAALLRDRGHDVISVHDRPELIGLPDERLFALLAAEGRAVVTENWADFHREVHAAFAEGRHHSGALFTSRRRLPRRKDTIGLFVNVLDDFLKRHPAENALENASLWI